MMTQPPSVIHLPRQQAEQLAAYCPLYRAYIWRTIPPSPERNQILRAIQTHQGRLVAFKEQEEAEILLQMTTEESCALRQMLTTLLALYGAEPPSHQRTHALEELAILRALVERTLHSTRGRKGQC